jgi:hypothetical protein
MCFYKIAKHLKAANVLRTTTATTDVKKTIHPKPHNLNKNSP